MKRLHTIAALLFALSGSEAFAGQYTDDLITLQVPPGFEGPIETAPAPQAKVIAYTAPYGNAAGGTLFQISEYDFGLALRDMPKDQRADGAAVYLKQFLAGIENRRTNFSVGAIQRIKLGGLPAAKIAWTGDVNGQHASGVMYCVIIRTVVVAFHTQDTDDAPPQNRTAALSAFESVTVRNSD